MKQLEKDYLAALYLAALSTKWYQFRKRKHLFQAAEQYRLMYIDNENLSVSQHETPEVGTNKEKKEITDLESEFPSYKSALLAAKNYVDRLDKK